MAIHAPITGAPICAPFAPVPPAAVTRILARFERDQLAGFIAVAIDLLDASDGDPDAEPDADGEAAGDEADMAWTEWHTRGSRKTARGMEQGTHSIDGWLLHEDDEEDDDAGQSTEDEASYGDPGFGMRGPGCPIGDPAECGGDIEPWQVSSGWARQLTADQPVPANDRINGGFGR